VARTTKTAVMKTAREPVDELAQEQMRSAPDAAVGRNLGEVIHAGMAGGRRAGAGRAGRLRNPGR